VREKESEKERQGGGEVRGKVCGKKERKREELTGR
jgi:hypothetical protein